MSTYELYEPKAQPEDEDNLWNHLDQSINDLDTKGERVKFLYEVIPSNQRC